MLDLIKKWLEKLSCKHTWKLTRETDLYSESTDTMPVKTRRTYVCTECGKFKKIYV